ncbi:MAG: hypothetical protein ACI4KF_13050 [Huintestinicola sp.]
MNKKTVTAVYTAAHFFVDMACAFLMFGYIYSSPADGVLMLVYNFCAFALQMPLGIISDRFRISHGFVAFGCLLIAAAFAVWLIPFGAAAIISAVLAGLGNALFHVGGGVYVLRKYDDSGALGVFVSTGAVGLYLGTMWGKDAAVWAMFPVIVMMIFSAASFFISIKLKAGDDDDTAAESSNCGNKRSAAVFAAAAMIFTVVVIRSFGGFMVALPWKKGLAAFAAVIMTAGGKAMGGFLSDKLGRNAASAVSMSGAALMFCFSGNMLCGLAALLLFNMSMPITLRAAGDIFHNDRGFSFGLLTFALFIGYIPVYLTGGGTMSGVLMSALCILSMALLLGGFRLMGDKSK